jgi:glycosyltransferase involved in cell wall biosynthesis
VNLLFVAPSAYLLGGVQDWLADLVADQRQRGVKVTVAVPDDTIHRRAPYAKRYPSLAPIPFRNPTGSEAGRIHALEQLLRAHPDHVVAGVNIAALYPAVRRLRRQGDFRGHLVMTLHAIEADYFADLRDQNDLLDGLVVTNRLSGELARALGGMKAERVFYAPYGVELGSAEWVEPAPATGEAGTEPMRIAWVGRLDRAQKRVQDLAPILEALDRQDIPFQLTIAGDGPERTLVEASLAARITAGQVIVTGAIPRSQLAQRVYRTHQVLLITSAWETGPIVAWEAMAAGLAVVSSRYVGSGLEGALVHGSTALLFPVGDAREAAAQLASLRNPAGLRELGQAGFNLVKRRYSRDASLAAWMAAFQAVAALAPLPAPGRAVPIAAAGGLDRRLGPEAAERLRRLLRRRFRHREAGSEWPHSGHASGEDASLLELAGALDRGTGIHD